MVVGEDEGYFAVSATWGLCPALVRFSPFQSVTVMKFNEVKKSILERTRIRNKAGGEGFNPDSPELSLYKVTINNLLEDKYYEEDEESLEKVTQRFEAIAEENPEFALQLADYARNEMGLRDISQVLLVLAANNERTKQYVSDWASSIISRADELCTVIAIQLELFGKPIPPVLKRSVAESFFQFDRYQISKYRRERREVSLRDVVNLTHPNPTCEKARESDVDYEDIFEKLIRGDMDDYPEVESLESPETWEVVISEKGSTKEAWRDVLPRMGIMAKIRNVRNMKEVGLSGEEILTEEDLEGAEKSKMFPFRFYQSYKALKNSEYEDEHIEEWLSTAIDGTAANIPDGLKDTFVGIDLSGSMDSQLSNMSGITYKEISAFFGAILMKKGADVGVFGDEFKEVDAHHKTPTLELQQKILNQDVGHSTNGWKVLKHLRGKGLMNSSVKKDRVVFLTDMQIWDSTFHGAENTVKEQFDKYRKEVSENASLFMLDLSSYGELVTPEGYEGVFNISGWNSKIIDFIEYAEDQNEIIEEIESREA